MDTPPTRYRVIERDRRLVTIDTLTGEEIGRGAPSPIANTGRRIETSAEQAMVTRTPDVESPWARLATKAAFPKAETTGPAATHSQRLAGVAVAAMLVIAFLVYSGLWVVPVALMLVPATRKLILERGLPALKAFLERG